MRGWAAIRRRNEARLFCNPSRVYSQPGAERALSGATGVRIAAVWLQRAEALQARLSNWRAEDFEFTLHEGNKVVRNATRTSAHRTFHRFTSPPLPAVLATCLKKRSLYAACHAACHVSRCMPRATLHVACRGDGGAQRGGDRCGPQEGHPHAAELRPAVRLPCPPLGDEPKQPNRRRF